MKTYFSERGGYITCYNKNEEARLISKGFSEVVEPVEAPVKKAAPKKKATRAKK